MNLNPPLQNNNMKISSTTENNPIDNSRMQSNYNLFRKFSNKNIIKNEQNTLENPFLTNSSMNKNIMTITKTTNNSNINNNDSNKEYIINEETVIVPKLTEKSILKDNRNRNINYDNEPKLLSEKIIINNIGNSSTSNQLISNLLENNNKNFNIHSNDTNRCELTTIFQTLGSNSVDNSNIISNNNTNINNTYEINIKKKELTDKSNENIFMTFGTSNGNENKFSNNANTIEFSSIVNNNDTNKQTLNEIIKNDNIFNADSEKKKNSQNPFHFSSFSTNPFTNTNQDNINIKKKELNTEEQKNNISPFTSITNLNNKEKNENKESNNPFLKLMLNDNPFLSPPETIPKNNPFSININKENKTDSNIFNNKKNDNTLDIFKSEANLEIAFNNINNNNINEYNPMEKNFTNNSIKNSSIFFSNYNSQETSEKKDGINNNKELLNKKEIVNDNFEKPFKPYEIKGEKNSNIFVSPISNYKKNEEDNNMIGTISLGVTNPKIILDNNITNQNKIKEFNNNENENNKKYIENFKEKKENEIEFSEIIEKKEFPKYNDIKKETTQSNELFTLNNIIINNNEIKEEIDDSNKNNKKDDLEKKNDNIMDTEENNNSEKRMNNNIEDEFKSKNILSDIIINKKDGINNRLMSQKELNNKNRQPIQSFNTELFNNMDNPKKKKEEKLKVDNYKDKKEKKGLFDNIIQNEEKKIQFSFLSNSNNNDNKENIFNPNKGSNLFEEIKINEKINNDIKEYMNNNIHNSLKKNENFNSLNENENRNKNLWENNKESKVKLGKEIEKKDKEKIKEFGETLEEEKEENDEENNEKKGNDRKEEENNKNEKENKQNQEILKEKKDTVNLKTCEIKMNNKESEEVEDSDEEELSGEEEEYNSEKNKNKNNNTVSQTQNNEIINYSKRKPLKREMYSNLLEIMYNITSKRKNKINVKEKNVLTVFNNKLNADLEKLKNKIVDMKKNYIEALIKKHFAKEKNKKKEVILRANIPKRRNEVKRIFLELITFIENKLEPNHRKYYYMLILNIITKYKNISDNEMKKNIPKIRQKMKDKKIKEEKNNKKINKNDANHNYDDKIWIIQYNPKKNFALTLFAVFLPLAYL